MAVGLRLIALPLFSTVIILVPVTICKLLPLMALSILLQTISPNQYQQHWSRQKARF